MKPNRIIPAICIVVYTALFFLTWQFSHGRNLLQEMKVEMNFKDFRKGFSAWTAHLPDTVIDGIHFNFQKRHVFIEPAENCRPINEKYFVDSNRIVFTGRFYSKKTLPGKESDIVPIDRSYVFQYTWYEILKPYYYMEWIPVEIDWDPNLSTRLIPPDDVRYILVK